MTQDEMWLLKERYNGEKSEAFFADCKRLTHDEPLAYVIGSMPFLNTTIYLDSRPLIPRPETEYWVEKIIPYIQKIKNPHVLDLCAGSGCIGIAILDAVPMARVDFEEIDTRHHKTILKNIKENNIDTSRTRIFGGDLFEHITDTYDVILTNPPYIDPILNRTQTSVEKFEPHNALYGGNKGIEIITQIIKNALHHLKHDGILIIEHEPEQVSAITILGKTQGFITKTHTDQYHVLRYTLFTRKDTYTMPQ